MRDEFPKVGGLPGAPKKHPEIAIANAGYDSRATRDELEALGIQPLIRERGAEYGSNLGKVRWVVEGSIGWLKGFRRLRCRYDRKAEAVHAWTALAMSAIRFRLWLEGPPEVEQSTIAA